MALHVSRRISEAIPKRFASASGGDLRQIASAGNSCKKEIHT
jgi:hypothetical protein